MIDEIINLIEKQEYDDAEKKIEKILKNTEIEEEVKVKYYYFLAFINSEYKNKNKKFLKAKRYIKLCINSDHSKDFYYNLYERLEDDNIILEASIRKGISKFPNSIVLNKLLFKVIGNEEKINLLNNIKNENIFDESFIIMYFDYFFHNKMWTNIIELKQYIIKIRYEENIIFVNFALAISIIMSNKENSEDLKSVILILKNIITLDSNNLLENNAHIFLSYCYSLLGDKDNFESIIRKLPISLKYMDLDNYPLPIEMNFEEIYKIIFSELSKYANYSEIIKQKILVIYSLYLYYPFDNSEYVRFKKKDIKNIISYKNNFIKYIEYYKIISNMYLGIKDIENSVRNYLDFYKDCGDFQESCISLDDIFEYVDESNCDLINKISMEFIKKEIFNDDLCEYILTPLIYKLNSLKKNEAMYELTKIIDRKKIINCKNKLPLFEIAYSIRYYDIIFSKCIYELLINDKKSISPAVVNNLGIIYEELGDISKASSLLSMALNSNEYEEIYIRNNNRISQKIIIQNKALANLENENLEYLDILLKLCIQRDRYNCINIESIDLTKFDGLKINDLKIYYNKFISNNYLIKNDNKIIVNMGILDYLSKLSENIEKNKEYKNISGKINFQSLSNIGYNKELLKKINKVSDKELLEILKRDLKECAISYVIMQYKSTAILGGSIIEALLTYILKENNINDYIFVDGKGKSNKIKIEKMGIEQLLEVAKEEKLINITMYHLNHYIREYRNTIHPSVEIRKKFSANERNATMIWNILKETILSLE